MDEDDDMQSAEEDGNGDEGSYDEGFCSVDDSGDNRVPEEKVEEDFNKVLKELFEKLNCEHVLFLGRLQQSEENEESLHRETCELNEKLRNTYNHRRMQIE